MNLLGNVELSTVELPDALEFTVTRERSSLVYVGIPCLAAGAYWLFWRTGVLWLQLISAFAALLTALTFATDIAHGKETKFRVTRGELVAEGNLGRLFTTEIRIPASTVKRIRFDEGGEGISGLYVRHGWRLTCTLPYVNRLQAQSVIETIQRRFPELPIETRRKRFFLWSGKRRG